MPQLSDGTFLYGSEDHPTVFHRTRTFHTPHRSSAVYEMHRRANRWGGIWCVYPHPLHPGEYAVAIEGLLSGEPLARSTPR